MKYLNSKEEKKNHLYSYEDMHKAFMAGRKSKEPKLKYEPFGNHEPYASFELIKSFKQFMHENYQKIED